METNIDETLLISARVDLNSQIPITSQILRIAVYDEFKAYEAYTKIIEKFGLVQPFVNIKEAEAVHYSVLIQLAQKYNVEVPKNDWTEKIDIPNTIIECCELGVAGEIDNITMYNHLLSFATKNDIIGFNSFPPKSSALETLGIQKLKIVINKSTIINFLNKFLF